MPQTNPNVVLERIANQLKNNPIQNPSAQNLGTSTVQSAFGTYVHPGVSNDEFAPYFDRGLYNYIPGVTEQERAINQSKWEATGHMLGQVATNIVPQTLGSIASMVDIGDYGFFNLEANGTYLDKAMNFIAGNNPEEAEIWLVNLIRN